MARAVILPDENDAPLHQAGHGEGLAAALNIMCSRGKQSYKFNVKLLRQCVVNTSGTSVITAQNHVTYIMAISALSLKHIP